MNRHRIARVLDRLEQQAEEYITQQLIRRQEEARERAEDQRWEETLLQFSEALPEDLWDRVSTALDDERCPLWDWIENLYRGRCLLPENLSAGLVRRLVLIRLDEADKCSFEAVCLHCGLQYPTHKTPPLSEWRLVPDCQPTDKPLRYDLPSFFEHRGCPACGASSQSGHMNWAHLLPDGYWATHEGRNNEATA
jgi:hypothetical protein